MWRLVPIALMIGLLGLLLGLVGAVAGVFSILYGMGVFDYLGGRENNRSAVSKQVLAGRLLSLNDPAKPYQVCQGDSIGTDLVAKWKIADVTWYGVFNKSQLRQAYRAYLLLNEARHSVRCYEEPGSLSWVAGTGGLTPNMHYQSSFFGGRVLFKREYAVGYGLKRPSSTEVGEICSYKFDIDEIRGPLIAAVKDCGWEWVPVTAKRNAKYESTLSGYR